MAFEQYRWEEIFAEIEGHESPSDIRRAELKKLIFSYLDDLARDSSLEYAKRDVDKETEKIMRILNMMEETPIPNGVEKEYDESKKV